MRIEFHKCPPSGELMKTVLMIAKSVREPRPGTSPMFIRLMAGEVPLPRHTLIVNEDRLYRIQEMVLLPVGICLGFVMDVTAM